MSGIWQQLAEKIADAAFECQDAVVINKIITEAQPDGGSRNAMAMRLHMPRLVRQALCDKYPQLRKPEYTLWAFEQFTPVMSKSAADMTQLCHLLTKASNAELNDATWRTSSMIWELPESAQAWCRVDNRPFPDWFYAIQKPQESLEYAMKRKAELLDSTSKNPTVYSSETVQMFLDAARSILQIDPKLVETMQPAVRKNLCRLGAAAISLVTGRRPDEIYGSIDVCVCEEDARRITFAHLAKQLPNKRRPTSVPCLYEDVARVCQWLGVIRRFTSNERKAKSDNSHRAALISLFFGDVKMGRYNMPRGLYATIVYRDRVKWGYGEHEQSRTVMRDCLGHTAHDSYAHYERIRIAS